MTARSAFAASLVSLVAAASALTFAAPVSAAMPGPVAVATVSTADLDLSSAHGQALLKARLQRAAADVCGDASSADPAGKRWVKQCRADSMGKAWEQAQAQRATANRVAAR
ncbi:UrcA family protein [Sphingomonas sp. KRR8]|uniref:UrcA family protein n=1 Tax=Sphingomonas sp. KRR8 TaxID=2942996 RepID=UPI0020209343|nr:UrcA family protein [Sphingomonas sp. KRR8]URD60324.1 UrcA family protein [Sphingomonas sp. KRR8]